MEDDRDLNQNINDILNSVPGGIAVYEFGQTLKTLVFTDGIPKMQGFTREEYSEAIKNDAMDIVYAEDRPILMKSAVTAVTQGAQLHISYRVYCKSGDYIWVNLSAYPAGLSENGLPLYHAIFSNSTVQFNLYQNICDNSTTGALVIDAQTGEIYYANKTILQYSRKILNPGEKTTADDLFDYDITEDEIAKFTSEKSEFVHKINSSGKVLQLHTKRINWMERPSILVYAADITAEYQKQEELQRRYEEQVKYSRMLSNSAIASSMVNLTKNIITLQDTDNDGIMSVITKQTPQEGFESMYPHIPDENIRKKYSAIFNSKTIISDFEKGIEEKRILHPYDSYDYWMESSYVAVRNPKTGDLEVFCFAKDATEEVRQNDVFDALMRNEYEDVALINPQTGETSVLIRNPVRDNYEELKNCPEYEKSLFDFLATHISNSEPKKTIDALKLTTIISALKTQKTYTATFSVKNYKDEVVRKRLSFSFLNEYHTSILCTTQDITADFENEVEQRETLQHALEKAKLATKAKSEFLSRMSHDMRTPLNGILGLANLMKYSVKDKAILQDLSQMELSGQYLLNLINDTLDVSRIESGMLELHPTVCDGKQIFESVIALSKPVIEAKHIHSEYSTTGLTYPKLYIDVGRVQQVMMNILGNAAKFTPEGGNISCTMKNISIENGVITDEVCIRDSGIGMDKDFLPHIFEPFSQADTSKKNSRQGTGLGMIITKQLVELMGGKISIESELNKGTAVTFTLVMPIATEEQISAFEHTEQKLNSAVSLDGKRILLCEDHPLNAKIAIRLLEKKGIITELAMNGKVGLDMFSNSKINYYDAVLMDIRMPKMDGLETARAIRSLNRADAKTVPIIAMTANAFDEDVAETKKAGMNMHLSKPIVPQKLYQALENMIESSEENKKIKN